MRPPGASTAVRALPALALMALIWWLSDQPDLNSGLGTLDFILRKLVHMAEFGLLFLLWRRALPAPYAAPAAAAIALGWAVADELHQSTVQGRHGTPTDVLIDAAGIALAWAAAVRLRFPP